MVHGVVLDGGASMPTCSGSRYATYGTGSTRLNTAVSARASSGLGVAFALGSALGYAGVILGGRMLPESYHPLQVTSFGFTIGADGELARSIGELRADHC